MNETWVVLTAAFVSYWIGALNPASIAARMLGADLRGTGSGNPGATNAARTMGRTVGIVVGLLDVAKGFLPALWFSRYGDPTGQVAGLAAVVGHITSPFLKGKGGNGVATSLGAILAIQPLWAIPVLAVFAITVKATGRIGIGSVAGGLTLIPTAVIANQGHADTAFGFALAALIVGRHNRNIAAFWAEHTTRT